MSDIIFVTNRHLCKTDFLARIELLAACRPAAILLREKDLTEEEYKRLAADVIAICARYDTPCILHTYYKAALELRALAIHLPLPVLRGLPDEEKARFGRIGASCHTAAEAREAKKLGCDYITIGNIFETDCKKGLPGKGVSLLTEARAAAGIPVYAIGGISPDNIGRVRAADADGACVMSGAMTCDDPREYLRKLERGDF